MLPYTNRRGKIGSKWVFEKSREGIWLILLYSNGAAEELSVRHKKMIYNEIVELAMRYHDYYLYMMGAK